MGKKVIHRDPLSAAMDYFMRMRSVTTDTLGIAIGYSSGNMITAIRHERSCGTEPKRRAIAKYFEKSYDEFLEIGQSIINDTFTSIQIPSGQISITATPPEIIIRDAPEQCQKCGGDILNRKLEKHQELVGGFKDHEMALEIDKMLLEIEAIAGPAGLGRAMGHIESLRNEIVKKKDPTGTANGTEGRY